MESPHLAKESPPTLCLNLPPSSASPDSSGQSSIVSFIHFTIPRQIFSASFTYIIPASFSTFFKTEHVVCLLVFRLAWDVSFAPLYEQELIYDALALQFCTIQESKHLLGWGKKAENS